MKNNLASALSIALCALSILPACAQSYNREYGGTRVVDQNSIGLDWHDGSYISPGTLSQSAQGKAAGIGNLLPKVNMGSTVRTPGDNIYNGDGTDRQANGAFIYKDTERAMAFAQRRRELQQLARERQLERAQALRSAPQGHFYVPGSNGVTPGYDSVSTPAVQFRGNGTATYSDGAAPKTRGF